MENENNQSLLVESVVKIRKMVSDISDEKPRITKLHNDVPVSYTHLDVYKRQVEEGFDVQVVIDAGGSPTQIADDIAQQTWEKEGVRTTTINQLVAELIDSWATEDGQKAVQIVYEEVISKIGKF